MIQYHARQRTCSWILNYLGTRIPDRAYSDDDGDPLIRFAILCIESMVT